MEIRLCIRTNPSDCLGPIHAEHCWLEAAATVWGVGWAVGGGALVGCEEEPPTPRRGAATRGEGVRPGRSRHGGGRRLGVGGGGALVGCEVEPPTPRRGAATRGEGVRPGRSRHGGGRRLGGWKPPPRVGRERKQPRGGPRLPALVSRRTPVGVCGEGKINAWRTGSVSVRRVGRAFCVPSCADRGEGGRPP